MLTLLATLPVLAEAMGPLLTVVVGIVVVGLLWWATTLLPGLPGPVVTALKIVFVIVLLVLVIRFILHEFPGLASL